MFFDFYLGDDMEFLLESASSPFLFSLILVFGFFIMEIVGIMLYGFSVLNSHAFHFDIEHDMGFLSWLGFGKVPFMVILVLLLTFFGLSGFAMQGLSKAIFGFYLSNLLAIPLSFAVSIPFVALFGKRLGNLVKDVETEVFTEVDFIGQTAVVVLGDAKKDHSTQAKFLDKNGHIHYVMIKVENDDVIKEGESVVLKGRVSSDSPFFLVSKK